MRLKLIAAGVAAALSACATAPVQTAWGKPGVSKLDFGSDIGMCTGIASRQDAGSGVNTAGGVSGKNSGSDVGSATAGASAGTVAGGTYQGMVSTDYAQRAATQQRAQEMATKRAQAEVYRACLTERGYKEFVLSPEQGARLASFKPGTEEYYEYLYSISSDPAVVGGSN